MSQLVRRWPQPPVMISWKLAIAMAVAGALLAVSSVVSAVALGVCIVLAFLGPMRALQALMAATIIAYGNPAIIKQAPLSGVLVRLVLVVVVLRMIPTVRASDLRLMWPVWLFAGVAAVTSAVASAALPISLMKIAELVFAGTAVLLCFNHLTARQRVQTQSWFLTVGLVVIGLSTMLLFAGGVGRGKDGGLQGILNQPQALGIFIAPFAAWSLAGVLLMKRKASPLEVWVAVGTLILILLTKARTAAAAAAFGVAVVMLGQLWSRRTAIQAKLGRSILMIATAAVVALGVGLASGKMTQLLTEFAYKGTQKDNRDLGEAFYASRGGGALLEWSHFLDRPLVGNGFGVYPDGKFPMGVTYFAGIPISAPIEKGFLPTAVLEETGLLGGVSLAVMILWLGREAWRNADLRWRAMFVACLGVNFGECVLMAPGGIGMFDWLLLGLALSSYRSLPLGMPAARRVVAAPASAASAPSGAAGAAPNPASKTLATLW